MNRQDAKDAKRSWKKNLIRGSLSFFVFLGVGYLSSVVSASGCAITAAQDIVRRKMPGNPCWVSEDHKYSKIAFSKVEGPIEWYNNYVGHPDGARRASVGPPIVKYPFLVSVEYSWWVSPIGAATGEKWYFCLFGWHIEIKDWVFAVC